MINNTFLPSVGTQAPSSEPNEGGSLADQTILDRLFLLKEKTESIISATPVILKRANDCISRIEKLENCDVKVPSVFNKRWRNNDSPSILFIIYDVFLLFLICFAFDVQFDHNSLDIFVIQFEWSVTWDERSTIGQFYNKGVLWGIRYHSSQFTTVYHQTWLRKQGAWKDKFIYIEQNIHLIISIFLSSGKKLREHLSEKFKVSIVC